MRFFLGTHETSWLRRDEFAGVPLFISARRLARTRGGYPASARGVTWALDSGGFTELQMHGGWKLPARAYALKVRTYRHYIDGMEWAACQDWMCEPDMLKRTGLSVEEHQRRTVANYLELRSLAPDVAWTPALQGWEPAEYLRCAEMYDSAGVDLAALPRVGIGTVCRRQHTAQIEEVARVLQPLGLRRHWFGVKELGALRLIAAALMGDDDTGDSLGWSFRARRGQIRMPGCTHRTCANCPRYALHHYRRLLSKIERATPRPLRRAA